MTGFKEGASSSPFDEDDGESSSDGDTVPAPGDDPEAAGVGADHADEGEQPGGELPYLYRRGGTRDGRTTKQIHLQPETMQQESEFLATVERLVGEDVYRADLREAALLVAMDHPAEVADQLREWGYDYDS